jgi:hypothetical protein
LRNHYANCSVGMNEHVVQAEFPRIKA